MVDRYRRWPGPGGGPATTRAVASEVIEDDGYVAARGARPGNRAHGLTEPGGIEETGFDRDLGHADPNAVRRLRRRCRRRPCRRGNSADARYRRDKPTTTTLALRMNARFPLCPPLGCESYPYAMAQTT